MTDPVFVVLRAGTDAVQTIGPASEAFFSLKQASVFAKEMSNQHPQHTYYVCQTIEVYEVQSRVTVKKVTTLKPIKNRNKLEANRKDGPVAPCEPNIYPIRGHGIRAG